MIKNKVSWEKWVKTEMITLKFYGKSKETLDVPEKIVKKYMEDLKKWYDNGCPTRGPLTYWAFSQDLRKYIGRKLNKKVDFYGPNDEPPMIGDHYDP